MRRIVLALALAGGLGSAGAVRADDVAEVKAALARFDQAFASKDVESLTALIAHDADVTFFGADIGDRWIGWNAIRAGLSAEFKRSKTAKIESQPAAVHVRGTLAFFERQLVMNLATAEGEMSIFARSTGVLEKRGGPWLIVQSHMSVGAARESGPRE